MAFPKRRWNSYQDLPYFGIQNGQWVEDEESLQLIGNALALHGKTFHNVGGNQGHRPTSGSGDVTDFDLVVAPEQGQEIIALPLQYIHTGAGRRIRIWVKAERADGASSAWIRAVIGRNSAKAYITAAAATMAWHLLEVEIPPVENPLLATDAELELYCGVDWDYGEGNQETISIRTVSVNEAYRIGAETDRWKDTTGANNKLGDPDYPFSTGAMRVLAGNAHAAYQHRGPRSNIFQRCYRTCFKDPIGALYDANFDGLGEWVIRKGWSVNQINGLYAAWGVNPGVGHDDVTVLVSLYSHESVPYDNITQAFNANYWVTGQTSGARGLIVKNDAAGQHLCLCYATGTFADNETLLADDGGEALVNGTNAGPRLVTSHEQVCVTPGGAVETVRSWSVAGLIDHEAEYIMRADAKTGGSTATRCVMPMIWAAENLGVDSTVVPPNPVHAEQDDDVRGSTWSRVGSLLEQIYMRRRQVVMQDFRHSKGGGWISAWDSADVKIDYSDAAVPPPHSLYMDIDVGTIDGGPLFASKHSRYLVARVWVRRSGGDSFRRVDVDNIAGAAPGRLDTIVGGTSGATATVYHRNAAGATATLSIRDINGAFLDNEQITGWGGGSSADIDGVPYAFEARPSLRLAVYRDVGAGYIATATVDCSRLSRDKRTMVEIRLELSPEWWEDRTIHPLPTYGLPYMWALNAMTTDAADYLIIDKDIVFEEPILPGGWEITREDDN